LFGHIKGAFTGAQKDREGLVEVADEGTLFLDEIGDMENDVQAQFLTAIEERSFRRVGENKVRKSDFRLICATNRNLLHDVRSGKFRKDLYFRICIFPINIPPLQERKDDIRELTDYFLQRFGYPHLPLKKDVYTFLAQYNWPGNVRELRNMLERALLISKGEHLNKKHFPGLDNQNVSIYETKKDELQKLAVIEMNHIKKVLKYTNNDKKRTCSILDISLSALYRRLEKYKSVTDFQ
jgi:transcriptional regulator with PAS, ATPase and Fis domain